MSAFLWITLVILYLTAVFAFGLSALGKGPMSLFCFGILFVPVDFRGHDGDAGGRGQGSSSPAAY